ncbi:MAG: alpha/beta hydrolase [Alkalispirochaetaceae bacterium]
MLETIVITPEEPQGMASAFDPESPYETGLLMHGFGATAEDLMSLAPSFPVRRRWIFPHGPQELRWGGSVVGRAWFPRRKDELEAAMSGAYFSDLSDHDPEGLDAAADELVALLEAQGARLGETLIGGFSQGAIMSVELLTRLPEAARGGVLFSGAVVAQSRWKLSAASPSVRPGRFVQSHGTGDQVLSFSQGRALYDLLDEAGWRGSFLAFDGGHEIPGRIVSEAARYLYED